MHEFMDVECINYRRPLTRACPVISNSACTFHLACCKKHVERIGDCRACCAQRSPLLLFTIFTEVKKHTVHNFVHKLWIDKNWNRSGLSALLDLPIIAKKANQNMFPSPFKIFFISRNDGPDGEKVRPSEAGSDLSWSLQWTKCGPVHHSHTLGYGLIRRNFLYWWRKKSAQKKFNNKREDCNKREKD